METKTLSIIVPAYNEEKNLPRLIDDIWKVSKDHLKEYNMELIVVDDGSRDNTIKVAQSLGAWVIGDGKNQGKGAAFRKGIAACKGDYIVQIDADHQFQPYDIPRLVEALEKGADTVLGSRFIKDGVIESGAVSKVNRFGNWLMSLATSLASGVRVYDIMAGFKAFKRDALLAMDLETDHFGYEAETVVKSSAMNFMVSEVPITYTHRLDGKSNVKKIKDGLLVLQTIIRIKFKCFKARKK